MSEEPAAPVQQQQAFPPPPSFYKLYRQDADGTAERPLPPEPPPVVEGTYQMFGELHTTESGVPPLQVRQLYEVAADGSIDFRGQLLALNRELLFGFAELLQVLIDSPSQYARQVENLGALLRNMLHLTNLLRPHQARATLEQVLKVEIEERRKAVRELREAANRAREVLASGAQLLAQVDAADSDQHMSDSLDPG